MSNPLQTIAGRPIAGAVCDEASLTGGCFENDILENDVFETDCLENAVLETDCHETVVSRHLHCLRYLGSSLFACIGLPSPPLDFIHMLSSTC